MWTLYKLDYPKHILHHQERCNPCVMSNYLWQPVDEATAKFDLNEWLVFLLVYLITYLKVNITVGGS